MRLLHSGRSPGRRQRPRARKPVHRSVPRGDVRPLVQCPARTRRRATACQTRLRNSLRTCDRRGRPDAPRARRMSVRANRDRAAGRGSRGDEGSSSRTVRAVPSWTPDLASGFIVACSLMLAAAVVVGRGVQPAAAMLIVLSAVVAWHRWIFTWHVLLVCRHRESCCSSRSGATRWRSHLPFGLELYRIAVALVLLVWVASLLVDPRVRLRRTPLDAPVALIVAASLGSVAVNFGRVAPLASAVLKGVTLFLSFIIFFYFIASVVTSVASVVVVTKFIVSGVAVVAFFAIVEQRTGFNVFDHVRTCLPVPAIRRLDHVSRGLG